MHTYTYCLVYCIGKPNPNTRRILIEFKCFQAQIVYFYYFDLKNFFIGYFLEQSNL